MLYFPRWKIALILGICLLGLLFTAPNLVSRETARNLPGWLPHQQINLGLDLQGGAHLLLEVEMQEVIRERLEQEVDAVRTALREQQILYTDLGVSGQAVTVRIREDSDVARALKALRQMVGPATPGLLGGQGPDITVEDSGDNRILLRLTERAAEERKRAVVLQSIEIVRRRIDELGTREATIQRQGEERILVQVPGLGDPARLKDLLGQTAKLTFHMVDLTTSPAEAAQGRIPPGSTLLPADPSTYDPGQPQQYVVRKRALLTGEMLEDAQVTFQQGQPVVSFRLNTRGGRRFAKITQENVGRPFAIVLDNKVISAPRINEPIPGGSGIISGGFTVQSANDLAILLRAGALPAPLEIIEERTVGPGLGQDSVQAGKTAAIIGLVVVAIFIVLAYGSFGLVANLTLLLNLILIGGALSLLQATLTLPGIAGIVLTIGMAVDANVLVFERIREEVASGKTPLAALEAGYSRAYGTILDANITTLISAIILFQFGSGPVKGFAVTLSIGIITSVFSAVTVTRLILATWARRRRPKALPI